MNDQLTKEANRSEVREFSQGSRKGRAIADRRRGSVVRFAGMIAGFCGAGLFVAGCGRPKSDEPVRYSDSKEWETYKGKFVTADGRVLDTANGDITHSEGVGYALLLAVHYNDRKTFDRVWQWSAENLRVRDDGLFVWRWQPGANEGAGGADDFNNATDGDVLIAWALLRGAGKWGSEEFQSEAFRIMARIREEFVKESPIGPLLLPGQHGFEREDGELTVNPSYSVFPAFEAFAEADETAPDFWPDLTASGLRLIQKARFADGAGLAPDWLTVLPSGEIKLPEQPNFPAEFGYNAVRVPLYLAWAGYGQTSLLQDYARFPDNCQLEDGRMAATWNLRSGTPGPDPAMPGAEAIFEFSRATMESGEPERERMPALDPDDAYYSASLLLLTKMALDERTL